MFSLRWLIFEILKPSFGIFSIPSLPVPWNLRSVKELRHFCLASSNFFSKIWLKIFSILVIFGCQLCIVDLDSKTIFSISENLPESFGTSSRQKSLGTAFCLDDLQAFWWYILSNTLSWSFCFSLTFGTEVSSRMNLGRWRSTKIIRMGHLLLTSQNMWILVQMLMSNW